MRIVVEGCGQWAAEQYFKALRDRVGPDDGVFFTYDSTFGMDSHPNLPARLHLETLQATLNRVKAIEEAGFACFDVKDARFGGALRSPCRKRLPKYADVVFVVTPDDTHCQVAEFWLGRAGQIFVEKPFDISARRIARFCAQARRYPQTKVCGLDHYFVRCNQAAARTPFFLEHLLPAGPDGLQGSINSFEFVMTEPPARDEKEAARTRERALSLQAGMVFDMASHALPVLLPFIDLRGRIDLLDVWAGVSQRLRELMFKGGETFSMARVRLRPRSLGIRADARAIEGQLVVGKDVGQQPQKHLIIGGPRGEVRFDLAKHQVYHKDTDGKVEHLAGLIPDWSGFFVNEVLEQRCVRAAESYWPERAQRVIAFLERWRNACRPTGAHGPASLPVYHSGADWQALQVPQYRTT
jgi:predicted dehydrogenase